MSWHPARPDPGRLLELWLKMNEWRHVGLSSRVKDSGGLSIFGQVGDGKIWVREKGGCINGALYISRQGVIIPAVGEEGFIPADSVFLERLLLPRKDRIFSMIGMEDAVLGLERHMGRRPPDAQDYRIFTLEGECRTSFLVMPGFEIRRASPEMADQLWPLEKAYQIEEVLRPGHNMNERLTRRHFTETLKRQLVYCGFLEGRPVAKAGTNARGFIYDQIGGVYVEPEFRNLGIGRTVLRSLISRIAEEGRYSCLFVKSTNTAAIRLYRALGFADRGMFRISYWIG